MMIKKSIKQVCIALLISFPIMLPAQVNIVSSAINSFYITPKSLCEVNIINNVEEMTVYLEAEIINASNQIILKVKTAPFKINVGFNSSVTLNVGIQQSEFGTAGQTDHVKSLQSLPAGTYRYCCKLIPVDQLEYGDEYCDDIVSELFSYLYLITPFDEEIIETPFPVFVWNHSEAFNVLTSGEYFQLVIVELKQEQTPDAGVQINIPVIKKFGLTAHQLVYPFDAPELNSGQRYAWQIQKIYNGVIVAQSEA